MVQVAPSVVEASAEKGSGAAAAAAAAAAAGDYWYYFNHEDFPEDSD
jgi:hypothetical protein